jgi:hypothetical protein
MLSTLSPLKLLLCDIRLAPVLFDALRIRVLAASPSHELSAPLLVEANWLACCRAQVLISSSLPCLIESATEK